jgi:hypothetical protein
MSDQTAEYIVGRKKYQRPQAMLWADNAGTLSANGSAPFYVPLGFEYNSITPILSIDSATPSAGFVKFTAINSFIVGAKVIIENVDPNEYNGTYTVTEAAETYFVVASGVTEIVVETNGSTARPEVGNFIILSDDNRGPIEFSQERIENRQRTVNGRMRSYHIADKLKIDISWDMLPSRSFKESPNFNTNSGAVTNPNISGNYLYQYTTDGGAGGAEILDWYENHPGSFWVYISYDKFNNFSGSIDKFDHLAEYAQIIEMFVSDFSYSVQKRGGTNYDFWNISVTLEEA